MIKKGDFVEIEYTGKLKDGDFIFDTTNKKIAEENGISNSKMEYGPVIICVGQRMTIPGLDDNLIGKEINKEYKIEILPEEGFGKKNAKLIQLIPNSKFKKQNINPIPGLQVEIDNQPGIVKIVTGGRVMVDFNHPLSGKNLVYEYKINKIIDNDEEKIKAYFDISFKIKDLKVKKTEKGYEISTKNEMPEILQKEFNNKLKEIISDKFEYSFSSENKQEKEEKKPKKDNKE